jgi:hypothetical protein
VDCLLFFVTLPLLSNIAGTRREAKLIAVFASAQAVNAKGWHGRVLDCLSEGMEYPFLGIQAIAIPDFEHCTFFRDTTSDVQAFVCSGRQDVDVDAPISLCPGGTTRLLEKS